MLNFFGGVKKPLKGYKITTIDRKHKYGIAANSLKMLKDKAAVKLKIDNCRVYLAKDGTEIDDEAYFETIEPQTLFIIATDANEVKTDFQLLYETLRNAHGNVFETANSFRAAIAKHRDLFGKLVEENVTTKQLIEKTRASGRDEHAEWFEGVPSTLKTKEDVMSRRSQDRIRGYYYKTKEELQKSSIYRTNMHARQLLDEVLEMFQYLLIGVDYFSVMFNRKWNNRHRLVLELENNDNIDGTKAPPRKKAKVAAIRDIIHETTMKTEHFVSLCNELGEFHCHGIWSDDRCQYENHHINPYASRENMILFQMWNLDHQIEITRSVLPKLLSDIQLIAVNKVKCTKHKQPATKVSVMQYFLELFTMYNLRLVHIVCHDKTGHNLQSNGTILCDKCSEFKALQKIFDKIRKLED